MDIPEQVAHVVVEVGVWSPRRIDEEKKEIPGIIDDWRREARTDPLPEVRRTWKAQ